MTSADQEGGEAPLVALQLGDVGLWSRLLVARSFQDSADGYPGYDATLLGVAAGADLRLSETFRAGLYGAYAGHSLTLDDTGRSSATGQSLHLGVTGAYAANDLRVDLSAGYFHTQWQSKRTIVFSSLDRTARADIPVDGLAASLDVGWDVDLDGWTLTPKAGADYIHQHQAAYDERGAGDIGLRVSAVDTHSLRTRLGASVSREFHDSRMSLTPEVSAQWSHELLNDSQDVSCAFQGGGRFDHATADSERDSLLLTASLAVRREDSPLLFLQATGDLGSDSLDLGLSVGLRLEF